MGLQGVSAHSGHMGASGSLSPLIFSLKLPPRDAALGPHPFPRTGFLMV